MYKTQWESITPEQESHHSIFRERKHAIGTTCVRYRSRSEGICACYSRLRCSPAPLPRSRRQGRSADGQNDGVLSRSGGAEPQTAQRHSCHLHLLQLRSRCGQHQRPSLSLPFFNGLASDLTSCTPLFLGYVQGMNDLLSPTMMIMQDEVDSFWCFKGIMDNMVALLPACRSPSNRHTLLRFPITDACLCTGPGGQLRTRTTGNASAVGAASRDPLRARPPALRPHGQARQP